MSPHSGSLNRNLDHPDCTRGGLRGPQSVLRGIARSFTWALVLTLPLTVTPKIGAANAPRALADIPRATAETTMSNANLPAGLYAEFTTPRGIITAELFYTRAPLMCANFTGLAEGSLAPAKGRPFYTGLTWYRVVPGFVLQSGNPGLKDTDDEKKPIPHHFADEFARGLRHDAAGILSMANAGPDTNSCEFFLTLAATRRLNYLHSVFGRVVRGLEVLAQIKVNDPVAIKIIRVGAAARAFDAGAANFLALDQATRAASAGRERPTRPHFEDPENLLPNEPPRAKNFNDKLANLERATGLRLMARLQKASPRAEEDAVPGAFMRNLATQLGTAQRGALAVYFADEAEWRVWIGDELTAQFVGQPGTARGFTESGAMHEAKEPFLQAAQATAAAEFVQQQAARTAARQPPLPAAQGLKLHTDEILDGLILRLEPK